MTDDSCVLRRYAELFELPMDGAISTGRVSIWCTSEVCVAAAKALRFQADALERMKEY